MVNWPPPNNSDLRDLVFDEQILDGGNKSSTGVVLQRAQFKGCYLSNITFCKSDLRWADFTGARLENVRFISSDLSHANFARTHLVKCQFSSNQSHQQTGQDLAVPTGNQHDGYIQFANFWRCYLKDTSFNTVSLAETTFEASTLSEITFNNCEAPCANFKNLRCIDVSYRDGNLHRAVFSDSVFSQSSEHPIFAEGVNLQSADFTDTTFHLHGEQTSGRIVVAKGADLLDVHFRSSHLSNCDFHGEEDQDPMPLQNASFTNAGLANASFCNVDLSGATFDSAYLETTHFHRCLFRSLSCRNATFRNGAVIAKCEAESSVFTSTVFDNTTFKANNFLGSDFRHTCFTESEFVDEDEDERNQSIFDECSFDSTRFLRMNFQAGRFHKALFRYCNLSPEDEVGAPMWIGASCDFTGADFTGACLRHVRFAPEQELSSATFDECELLGASFAETRLHDSSFRSAYVIGAGNNLESFYESTDSNPTNSEKCKWTWRQSVPVSPRLNFSGADMMGLILRSNASAVPPPLDFSEADMSFANMQAAELVSAIFEKTILVGADFSYALLRDCKFCTHSAQEAVFNWASFGDPHEDAVVPDSAASWGPVRRWPIVCARIEQLHSQGGGFKGTNFTSCVLTEARFTNAVLDAANFQSAKLEKVDFSGASMVGTANLDNAEFQCDNSGSDDTTFHGFAEAYIVATGLPHNYIQALRQWFSDLDLNRDDQRKSWVAWKNNCHSLGQYHEESESFLEEKRCNTPGWWHHTPRWWHRLVTALEQRAYVPVTILARLVNVMEAAVIWLAHLVMFLGIAGFVYYLGLPHLSYFCMVILVFIIGIICRWRELLLDVGYGFGERLENIFANSVMTIVLFALVYCTAPYWGSCVDASTQLPPSGIYSEAELQSHDQTVIAPGIIELETAMYYSISTFTTLGLGDYVPYGFCRQLSAIQSLIGLVLAALLIHSIARRTGSR